SRLCRTTPATAVSRAAAAAAAGLPAVDGTFRTCGMCRKTDGMNDSTTDRQHRRGWPAILPPMPHSSQMQRIGGALRRYAYTLVLYPLTPVILYRLAFRGLRARGYFSRWFERFGFFPDPAIRSSIWVHAVSVGEVNAAAPLIDALRRQYANHSFVITTVTPTGSDRVRQLWGDSVFHVYLPYDLPGAIRRFLRRIRPSIAVIMETEIWPNLFRQCDRANVPILIANARLSRKSLDGYGPVRPLVRAAIRSATFIAAQSQRDAQRFLQLDARPERVRV